MSKLKYIPIRTYTRFNRKTNEEYVLEATQIHKSYYNYSLLDYKNYSSRITLICPVHDRFTIRADHHLKGAGCPECRKIKLSKLKRLSIETFIEKAIHIHGKLYNYSNVFYVNAHTKIEIVCEKHGSFFQQPRAHLYRKNGCPRCSKHGISKMEREWLTNNNLPNDLIHRWVLINVKSNILRVDGYNPKTNTVYEFNGDFWHGNPQIYNASDINPVTKTTYGELYEKTLHREKLIIDAGFNLISIWESNFISQNRSCY